MNHTVYWIWAQMALGIPCAGQAIFAAFDHPKALYHATPAQRKAGGCFKRAQLERMERTPLEAAQQVIAQCNAQSWSILTPQDAAYPARLRTLEDFPLVLYVWGEMPALDRYLVIAVVGARKCSSYGMRVADTFAKRFGELSGIVVSGGALGVDAAAHKGAVLGGGKTIAVLGCGLGTKYLQENSSLREMISRHGAVITEYPPMTEASRSTFPVRNRLISGLSHGTLVVEAGLRSGSLITARLAGEQGREVFAVPGGVLSAAYEGTNCLLRDGVTPAFTPEEVLEQCAKAAALTLELPPRERQFSLRDIDLDTIDIQAKVQADAQAKLKGLPEAAVELYHLLTYEPQYADDLRSRTDYTAGQVLGALTQLELSGLVQMLPGKVYVLAT